MKNDARPYKATLFKYFLSLMLSSGNDLLKCVDGDCTWITDHIFAVKYNPKYYGALPINPEAIKDRELSYLLAVLQNNKYETAKEECIYRRFGKMIIKLKSENSEAYIDISLAKWFNPDCCYEISAHESPVKVMFGGEVVGAIMPMRFKGE